VDDGPQEIVFPNVSGVWTDHVLGESFTASAGSLTVPMPPHRVRMMLSGGSERKTS